MKIVIAPDKYKGTLTAAEVCRSIEQGINEFAAFCGMDAGIVTLPLADGGEGSMEALVGKTGSYSEVYTVDPHGRNIKSRYGIVAESGIAVIEASQSIGLSNLNRFERNPAATSSYGFGVAVKKAIEDGHREFALAIGGTATNDCGIGMLSALGARFYDPKGGSIDFPSGSSMGDISVMDLAGLKRTIAGCRFTVVCDVSNPLLGERGAARVYSPQKGADEKCVEMLEAGARSFAGFATEAMGKDLRGIERGGAAGGLGWALAMFCDAELVDGAGYIGNAVGFDKAVEGADLVVTGEGRIDGQTSHGKVVGYVCRSAGQHNVPVSAYCGTRTKDVTPQFIAGLGLSKLFVLTDYAPFEQAMSHPYITLKDVVARTFGEIAGV